MSANPGMTGLGVMGYPMAVNLFKGLDASKSLLICDVSDEAIARFLSEARSRDATASASVSVVKNGYDAAKAAVCDATPTFPCNITF